MATIDERANAFINVRAEVLETLRPRFLSLGPERLRDLYDESWERLPEDVVLHGFAGYMYTIVSRAAIDALRRGEVYERHLQINGYGCHREIVSQSSTEQAEQNRLDIRAALQFIPAKYVRIGCLTHLRGWSTRDIGKHLGISHELVNQLLAVFNKELRRWFLYAKSLR